MTATYQPGVKPAVQPIFIVIEGQTYQAVANVGGEEMAGVRFGELAKQQEHIALHRHAPPPIDAVAELVGSTAVLVMVMVLSAILIPVVFQVLSGWLGAFYYMAF